MNEQLWPDHKGVWVISPPTDMPITVIAMLQATINEAWASYGGVPDNAEQFWNHLVGGGAADVPRETSWRDQKDPYQVEAIYHVNNGALRTAKRTVWAREWAEATEKVRQQLTALLKNDKVTIVDFYGGVMSDGGAIAADVPRETSQGEG